MNGTLVRRLGRVDYQPTWLAMQNFSASRTAETTDEIWLLEHPPVFTLGLAGKSEHLLREIDIPLVKTDRGGQITYHGPGQVIIYLLLDLRRRKLNIRELVTCMEQALIDFLASCGIKGERLSDAPGVYVGSAKIAALGLRVKNGCCYHGLSLNVGMDLSPYAAINPCGYENMAITQLHDLGVPINQESVGEALLTHLQNHLGDSHG